MIKTFADRHTQELYATGKSRRFPPDIARRATRKLEYLDLATRLDDLKVSLPATGLRHLRVIGRDNTPLLSTTSGASAFGSSTAMLMTWN